MVKTHKIRCKVTVQTYHDKTQRDIAAAIKSINVEKDLYSPAGAFQISFLPIRDEKGLSWYHRLAPMDYVEIQLARDPLKKEPPVIMRGFVDAVNMNVSVDQHGAPQRAYTVTGRDYGKILDISGIYYVKEVDKDLQYIHLPSFESIRRKWGVDTCPGDPKTVIGDLFEVAKKQLAHIQEIYPTAKDMTYLGSQVYGRLNSFALTQEDGSVWEFMKFFDNAPWNELYIMDAPDGPTLVFRRTPWKDPMTGRLIQGDDETYETTLGDPIPINPSGIIALDLSRSDRETKNYYFTAPIQNLMGSDTCLKAFVLQGAKSLEDLKSNPYFLNRDDEDGGINRFGFRRFENTTEYITLTDQNLAHSADIAAQLNKWMVNAHRYNSAFECGSFQLKGNEDIQVGKYIKIDNTPVTQIQPEYYVTKVSHDVAFEENSERFQTSIEVVRGTGFIETRKQLKSMLKAELKQIRQMSGRY
jgi:hypothetical protein